MNAFLGDICQLKLIGKRKAKSTSGSLHQIILSDMEIANPKPLEDFRADYLPPE